MTEEEAKAETQKLDPKDSFIKKVIIPCDIEGQVTPFTLYLGEPRKGVHPLRNQADWIAKEKSGSVPQGIMDSIKELYDVAEQNGITFGELAQVLLSEDDEDNA